MKEPWFISNVLCVIISHIQAPSSQDTGEDDIRTPVQLTRIKITITRTETTTLPKGVCERRESDSTNPGLNQRVRRKGVRVGNAALSGKKRARISYLYKYSISLIKYTVLLCTWLITLKQCRECFNSHPYLELCSYGPGHYDMESHKGEQKKVRV